MNNIIIFGTGRTSKIIESGLNDNVNIICYLDNDNSKWGSSYNGKEILNPNKINNLIYDYIIIASQFNESIYNQLLELGVSKVKILQFYKYFDSCHNHVDHKLQYLYQNNQNAEVIATGISYMLSAINGTVLCKSFGSIANASQDLYYDYKLMKYIIQNYKNNYKELKYAFIGVSYYSFQYDMSLSSMKGNVLAYYEIIGEKHNFQEADLFLKEKNNQKYIAYKIFKMDSDHRPLVDWECEFEKNGKNIYINEQVGKKQALLDGNKNYPQTVKENTVIFKSYLNMLKDNNIKPIVIICPVSKYYAKYFPQRLKDEFYKIINETQKEYNFQFIDYFNSDLFSDEDFYDVSHLNNKGAEKFTKILNEIVEW